MNKSEFYTYLWLREDGTPYYVGKGKGDRAFTSSDHRLFAPTNLLNILIQTFPSEEAAFAAEKFLIDYYGRNDLGKGCLRNLTDGGDGAAGRQSSPETCRKLSAALKGKPKSVIARQHMSIAAKNRPPISEETRSKISKNSANPSIDTRYKMRLAGKRRDMTEITRQNIESGHLRRIAEKGNRIGNHIRWHVNRNIVNPMCQLCTGLI